MPGHVGRFLAFHWFVNVTSSFSTRDKALPSVKFIQGPSFLSAEVVVASSRADTETAEVVVASSC